MQSEISKINLFDLKTVDDILQHTKKLNGEIKLITGVYFCFQDQELVYIGSTVNLYGRIGDHLRHKKFTTVYYIECSRGIYRSIENKYIQRFHPRLNITWNNDIAKSSITIKKKWNICAWASQINFKESFVKIRYYNDSLGEQDEVEFIIPRYSDLVKSRASGRKFELRKLKPLKQFPIRKIEYLKEFIYSYICKKLEQLESTIRNELIAGEELEGVPKQTVNIDPKSMVEQESSAILNGIIYYQQQNNLSNEQLAEKCKVSLYTLEHWLKTNRMPRSLNKLMEINKFLNEFRQNTTPIERGRLCGI